MHCVPQIIDPQFFGIQDKVVTITEFYDYPVKVIGKYFESYLEAAAADPNLLLLNYNEGLASHHRKDQQPDGDNIHRR
jgi:hypothetical protein